MTAIFRKIKESYGQFHTKILGCRCNDIIIKLLNGEFSLSSFPCGKRADNSGKRKNSCDVFKGKKFFLT